MRLFIAIDIPEDISSELRKAQEKLHGKMTKPEDFHQTLKFLGEVDEKKVDEIKERLKGITFSKFGVKIKGTGNFGRGKIIWAGLEAEGKIRELKKKVDEALSGMEFDDDKRFHPHITLARVKFPEGDVFWEMVRGLEVPEMEFEADRFRLYKSELTPKGPVYTKLAEFSSQG